MGWIDKSPAGGCLRPYCLGGDHSTNSRVALFAVDSSLDCELWFLAAVLYLGRLVLAGRDCHLFDIGGILQ